jgi:hypothetical protein
MPAKSLFIVRLWVGVFNLFYLDEGRRHSQLHYTSDIYDMIKNIAKGSTYDGTVSHVLLFFVGFTYGCTGDSDGCFERNKRLVINVL